MLLHCLCFCNTNFCGNAGRKFAGTQIFNAYRAKRHLTFRNVLWLAGRGNGFKQIKSLRLCASALFFYKCRGAVAQSFLNLLSAWTIGANLIIITFRFARVVELADTSDLGSDAGRCKGSSPFASTKIFAGTPKFAFPRECFKIENFRTKIYNEFYV